MQLYDDPWAEDPACYLSDEEIGLEPVGERQGDGLHSLLGTIPVRRGRQAGL